MLGLDLLGMGSRSWDINTTCKVFPRGWAVGLFATTFGDARQNLIKLLKTGKVSACRIQLWWSDNHVIAPLSVVKELAPRYEAIAKQFPAVKFYLSHSCEYTSNSMEEVFRRVEIIRKLAPSCTPVNAPLAGSATIPGVITEVHGDDAKPLKTPYIVSTDGDSIYDADAGRFVSLHSGSLITFLWGLRFNLAEARPAGTPKMPPMQRTAAPDAKYIKGVIRLGSPEGEAPKPTFKGKVIPFAKPRLYKSFAEDKLGEDVRANKPLTITPDKSPMFDVVTFNGKKIASFRFFDAYPPNLWRHYSGTGSNLYGWELAAKAKKASGSEFVWFKGKGAFYGPVNPAFRRGYFQS